MPGICPTVQQAIAFINNLDVGVPDFSAGPLIAEKKGSVADGNANSFVSELSGKLQTDVEHCMLIAQRAAGAKYDRVSQLKEWYQEYSEVLSYCGWIFQNFELEDVSDAKRYGSVDELLIHLATAYLSGVDLELFKAMIQEMKDSQNAAAVKIFDTASKKEASCNFQLGNAKPGANNTTTLVMGYFAYTASQDIKEVLFLNFGDQEVTFKHGHQVLTFDQEAYNQVRATVTDKLGDTANEFIKSLKF
ncbi:hypothetical protein B0H19DRAFT_1285126 [Mycena capillaripes]|nr:hypothetical protein B0H19DRAFT_1285126 [Mycena capillaripes]